MTAPGVVHPRIAQRRADVVAAARTGERRRRRLLWSGLAVSFVLVCGYLATRSELLDVERVTVERVTVSGAARTLPAEILDAAGIGRGQPLVWLDLGAARARVARLPWVKDVYSVRGWDGSVTFRVSERVPVAAVAMPGGWALTGAGGRVLEFVPTLSDDLSDNLSDDLLDDTVPVVGLGVVEAAPGDWLADSQLGAIAVAGALYEPIRSAVQTLEATPEGYVLNLHAPGRVILGNGEEMDAKLLAVQTFLEKVNLRCLEVLDVRAPATPVLTRAFPCG